jgi:peptide/nickel transport system substrate-binding protein
MKKGIIWGLLTCLIVTSMVLASCNKTTTSTSTPTQTTTTTTTKTTTTTTTTQTTTPTTTTATTTAATGNWWDTLGTPQYGGTMTLRINTNPTSFDMDQGTMPTQLYDMYFEQLMSPDWTVNTATFPYLFSFYSNDQAAGWLAKSWEFTSLGNLVIHLRQGIHWQNIAPANGRELVASDVVSHFDRLLGLGQGYTAPAAYLGTNSAWAPLTSVTAPDKYTVVMVWNTPNPEVALENLEAAGGEAAIECPEVVKQWGDLSDWHHAVGTGPFILNDYVSGSSETFVKNPDYWGYDERHPQNKLPYVDKVTYLVIPDDATALAAFRTGKIDDIEALSYQQIQPIIKLQPQLVQVQYPQGNTPTLNFRTGNAPFNDVRVRQALQMAIDLPTIAQTFYNGTTDPSPSTLTSNYLTGWGFPYSQWPQDLKDQYAYNPTGAKQLLAAAGFPNGFNTDVVVVNTADLDLLQIVKSYFTAIGVNMDIRPMDSASWSAFVLTNKKQDAMDMRQPSAGSLGLTFYPLRQIVKFALGNGSNTGLVNDPVYNAFVPVAQNATSTDQVKTVMTAANKYVAQQHYAVSLLQPMLYDLYWPWFKGGYVGQYSAVSSSSGPTLCGIFLARFWVDQNLKKSMGY